MRMAGERISRTLFNMLHCITNLDTLYQPVFYTHNHDIMCGNPSTKMIYKKTFFFSNNLKKIISCVMSYQHKFHASFQGQQNVVELAFLQLANIPSIIHNI
jgi:hypothetical protein